MKKVKTPEDLATESRKRTGYRLYLNVKNMKFLEESAVKAGVSVSKVVDEAVSLYIQTIAKKKR